MKISDRLAENLINQLMPWVSLIIILIIVEAFDVMDLLSPSKTSLFLFAIAVISVYLGLLFITRKYLNKPDIDLEFLSYFEPDSYVKINKGEKLRLVWNFKNNLSKDIRILSYNIKISLNNKPYIKNNPWKYNYNPVIPTQNERTEQFSEVSPEYYGLKYDGEYEFQSIIEYQLPNGEKKLIHHTSPLIIMGTAPL